MFIRNNVSTAISQLKDSLTFVTLAFVGTRSMRQLMGVMLREWVVKLIITGVDTPVVYLSVAWIRNKGEESKTAATYNIYMADEPDSLRSHVTGSALDFRYLSN